MLIIRSGARGEAFDRSVRSRPAGGETEQVNRTAADATADASGPVTVRAALNGHAAKSEKVFAADLEAGQIPGLRRIQAQLHVGQPRARLVQAHLRNVARTGEGSR